jgi:hypothetical protein
MVSRPELNALLIITHPGGAKSFDYEDYWDGDDLIYTGRGKVGPQKYAGQNRDLGENTRAVNVFEPAGPRALEYLGSPTCVEHFPGTGLDANGELRPTIRFRLRFTEAQPATRKEAPAEAPPPHPPLRRPRKFDSLKVPAAPAAGATRATPEELAQLREKANKQHHEILAALERALQSAGWTGIREIPGAVDMWAERDGKRVIFEAKSLTARNEIHQARSALAQLLEYRHFYGSPSDDLCIVTNRPLTATRVRFLESQNIMAVFVDGEQIRRDGLLAKALPM